MFMRKKQRGKNTFESWRNLHKKTPTCLKQSDTFLKKIFLTTFFIFNFYILSAYSQDSLRKNNLEFEWGNNIFGNTISLGLQT